MKALVLLRPHEHAGAIYAVGDTLTLDADAADWLITAGAATAADIPDTDATLDDSSPAGKPPASKKGKSKWLP